VDSCDHHRSYFNAPVFLENKTQIGKIDDIFGPMTERVRIRLWWPLLTRILERLPLSFP
jgi:hypothetical protein